MEAAIAGRHPHDRPDSRAQAADNQQGRLGKQVSHRKLRLTNIAIFIHYALLNYTGAVSDLKTGRN